MFGSWVKAKTTGYIGQIQYRGKVNGWWDILWDDGHGRKDYPERAFGLITEEEAFRDRCSD